jgi:ATP-dependent RNA helicase RhlB
MQFSEFSLSKNLLRSINEAGFTECTEVQTETLSHTLSGKDVFVQSQTGTGKTAAFLISLFELMERSEDRERALIIVPTRELAVQIEAEAKLLSLHQKFSVMAIFGGVGYYRQEKALADGVDILIGTPGRLIDLSNKRTLNFRKYNYAVIDEADRLFDMGFFGDIRKILGRMPKKNIRQTMLFSATLSYSVKQLASDYMKNPVEVHIKTETITVHNINQQLFHVGSAEKMKLLIGVLNSYNFTRALIFTNTKQMCEQVAGRLYFNGFTAEYLTGDLSQSERQKRMDRFKQGNLPILVATDVAARGLHIDDLELVVNYDIPQYCENYVHRIGRTARAGKSGTAVTLACERMIEHLAPIEEFIDMKIPSSVADDELYAVDRSAGKNYRHRRRSSQQRSRPQKGKKRYQKRGQHRKKDFRKEGSSQKEGKPYRKRISSSKKITE